MYLLMQKHLRKMMARLFIFFQHRLQCMVFMLIFIVCDETLHIEVSHQCLGRVKQMKMIRQEIAEL